MSLIDFLQTTFPERFSGRRLYHYSKPEVLERFFADDADMYCTYYAALNDSHEVVEGWDAVETYMEDVVGMSQDRIAILKNGYRELFYQDVSSPWIMSFSEDRDSLPQWSMYSDHSRGGYAFGFDRDNLAERVVKLMSAPKNQSCPFDMWLTPCFYDVESLQRIFDFYFNKHHRVVERFASAGKLAKEDVDAFLNIVSVIAVMVKQGSFKSEREWRLVKFPHGQMFETCEFVGGKPRHRTELFNPQSPLRNSVKEIVISPHGDRNMLNVNAAIMAMKYHLCIDVTDSGSSYNGR